MAIRACGFLNITNFQHDYMQIIIHSDVEALQIVCLIQIHSVCVYKFERVCIRFYLPKLFLPTQHHSMYVVVYKIYMLQYVGTAYIFRSNVSFYLWLFFALNWRCVDRIGRVSLSLSLSMLLRCWSQTPSLYAIINTQIYMQCACIYHIKYCASQRISN